MLSLLSKELSRVFSRTTVRKHPFFGAQTSLWSNSHIRIWLLEKPPLTIRTFVYLDESALSKYEFLLTSVWKLLMAFFFVRATCVFLCPQGQSEVRTSVAKRTPLFGPPPPPAPGLGWTACPQRPFSAQVSLLQGGRCPLGTPAPLLPWPDVLRVSFIL